MTYLQCPEHYLFRYVLGIKSPPVKAMKQGKAIHDTLAQHYTAKKETGTGWHIGKLQDFYEMRITQLLEEYERELEETKSLISKNFLTKEKEYKPAEMKDAGVRGLAAYKQEVDPLVTPDLVEQEFVLETNKDINIKGWIDLTDTEKIIHETKTSRKSQNIQEIARDPQLAIYQIGYEKLKGTKPASYSKDFIILGKKDAKIQRFELKKPDIDPTSMLRYIWNILKAIQNDCWYCVHPANSWVCSKDWCGYYKLHQELRKIGFEKMLKKYSHHEQSKKTN